MGSSLLRNEVKPDRIWSVGDILDESLLPKMFGDIESGAGEISAFRGKLTPENAIECFLIRSKILYKIEKAVVYLNLKSDEDKSNSKYVELCDKIEVLAVKFSTACSFIEPALAKFGNADLVLMRDGKKYEYYSMYLDSVIRYKKHLLGEKEEALLSEVQSFADDFNTVFSMFDNVDVNLGEVELDGKKVKMSHGLYSVCMQNPDAAVRKQAYENMFGAYKSMIDVIAANYAGSVKKNYFFAKARKFSSCLEQALYSENIPEKVYDNLISVVDRYTPYMHEYIAYRKKALKLDTMHMYDVYVPIVSDVERDTDYDAAFETVCGALKPLGDDYVAVLRQAKKDRWLDVEETANKKSGAYSWSVYGTHPFVLLNHRGTVHDTFTIAHEMGHAMHSYYSDKAQCYEKSGYCIFVAEIASTVNEVLLIKHLLKTATGNRRKYLLSYYIDMIRTTLFRQTMFAEFEKFAHGIVEKGDALSYEKMNEYYGGLNVKYYGDSVVTDDLIKYEWARIPHFYRAFYVYKYSTGIVCAINIANMILADSSFVEKYKKFLQSGGSMYPMDILALVGIDLTKKTPFINAMTEFKSVLSELKKTK
jgi:oligoendopeptidase F